MDGSQKPSALHQHVSATCPARLSASEGPENSGEFSFYLLECLRSLLPLHQFSLEVENRFQAKERKQQACLGRCYKHVNSSSWRLPCIYLQVLGFFFPKIVPQFVNMMRRQKQKQFLPNVYLASSIFFIIIKLRWRFSTLHSCHRPVKQQRTGTQGAATPSL